MFNIKNNQQMRIIIGSFFVGKKINVSELLKWCEAETPQREVFVDFLTNVYPTLTAEKHGDWDLDGYGTLHTTHALITYVSTACAARNSVVNPYVIMNDKVGIAMCMYNLVILGSPSFL